MIRALIQARMSSTRFPGKVLAPFLGEPIIAHVIRAVSSVLGRDRVVVATSVETSDDPLCAYLEYLECHYFRGPLQDVFERFRQCLESFPSEWALRICADSPLLKRMPLEQVIKRAGEEDCDIVTTTFPRTFPKGTNAELIRTATFMAIDSSELTDEDREHVTRFFYRNPTRFRIANVASSDPELSGLSYAVDTVEDLHRLEELFSVQSSHVGPLQGPGVARP